MASALCHLNPTAVWPADTLPLELHYSMTISSLEHCLYVYVEAAPDFAVTKIHCLEQCHAVVEWK